MSDLVNPRKLTPESVMKGTSPLVLTATLAPFAGDRFQPAGFPEVGHVLYKAPRRDGDGWAYEHVCIVDSAASMANHLEAVCMRGPHDPDLVEALQGMPFLRCVTGDLDDQGRLTGADVVVTSLTEGHRIASTYFLEGEVLSDGASAAIRIAQLKKKAAEKKKGAKGAQGDEKKALEKEAKKATDDASTLERDSQLQTLLARDFELVLAGTSRAHPPPSKWWSVYKTIFRHDPNALVHGVLFPQWQIKIPRMLTAHLEAVGAARVDRSGVKFDRLGKTTSGQPIFAVDDATAREIRATFILDVALVRSYGRDALGLNDEQKTFLVALALWKIQTLLSGQMRLRSDCYLRCLGLRDGEGEVSLDVEIVDALKAAAFPTAAVTDVFWPRDELYRDAKEKDDPTSGDDAEADEESSA